MNEIHTDSLGSIFKKIKRFFTTKVNISITKRELEQIVRSLKEEQKNWKDKSRARQEYADLIKMVESKLDGENNMNLDQALKSNIIDAVSRGDSIKYDYPLMDKVIKMAKAKNTKVAVTEMIFGKTKPKPFGVVMYVGKIRQGTEYIAATYDKFKDGQKAYTTVYDYILKHKMSWHS